MRFALVAFACVGSVTWNGSSIAASGDIEPLQIEVSGEPCEAQIEGTLYDNIPDAVRAIDNIRNTDRPVRIEGMASTPWRCVGGLIFALEHRGFTDIQPTFRRFEDE